MNTRNAIALVLFALLALCACRPQATEHMTGTLERDRIELVVESSEPITAIHVADGARVDAGTLVLEQDPERAAAALQQWQAQRDQAAARLAELQRGPRAELIREAQAQLESAQVVAANAQQDFERASDIYQRGFSEAASLDRATALRDAAAAQVTAQRETLARLLNGTTVEELQQAQAALQAAEASVRQAALDLQRTRIVTPSTGIIDKVLYEVGERPLPGSTIAVLLDDSRIFARIYVPADLQASVRPGTELSVALHGVEQAYRATVSWVSPEASFTPYFALTEHDRSRLSYLAEVELPQASELPTGLPLEAWLPDE